MPMSSSRLKPGSRYQVEVEGRVVEEFVAEAALEVEIDATQLEVYVSELPRNIDEFRDTFSARPPAPKLRFRGEGAPVTFAAAVKRGPGNYAAVCEGIGGFVVVVRS